jgi:hypothetical protein
VPFCQPTIPLSPDEELTMTQTTEDPARSFLDRLRAALNPPATERPADATARAGDDDDRRVRDESFYWGFCMNGHW